MKAIIFDFEGVLCDTRSAARNAMKSALKESGYYWSDDVNNLYEKSGRKIEWLESASKKRIVRNDDLDNIELSYRSMLADAIGESVFPERFVKRLETLKAKYDVRLALIGESDKRSILSFLRWTRLNELFDFVTCSEDAGGVRYPSSDLHTRSLQKLSAEPNDVVVLSGTYTSAAAAESAGLKRIVEASYYRLEQSFNDAERFLRG